MYSRELPYDEGVMMGYPVESDNLRISKVIAKNDSPRQGFELVIKQLVTYFGLVLDNVLDETGEFIRPDRLKMSI